MFDVNAGRGRRRGLAAAALCLCALSIASCGRRTAAPERSAPAEPAFAQGTLQWAAAGDWRTAADKQQDATLHPVQTLQFFGVRPGVTVVDVWPGAGWWTQILAPYLAANKGKFYAAVYETPNPEDPAAATVVTAYRKMLTDKSALYGNVAITSFGPAAVPIAPSGTADLVLFTHLDNWMAAGLAEKAFHDAYAALKPGGVLGVVQARGEAGGPQDPLASNGYVQEAFVLQMAKEAGFKFDKESQINCDPGDRRARPLIRLGKTPEPDRMTLRFVKPK